MPVIINDVQWGTSVSQVLPYYLNFSVLVQDQEAARYVRRALRRILALFPDANDHALDNFVESALHDAKKWLIRPKKEANKQILVGSLSVTGSTLKRYKYSPNTSIVGIIDCIRSPYYDTTSSDIPHLAALLWNSTYPIKTKNPPCYRRVGKSAFIEPVSGGVNLCNIVYDEKLYNELETNHLLKLGHWCYGDRHSLLELNVQLAIDQSEASESGAIPWIAEQITNLCGQYTIMLAFPVDKQAYRLAHMVKLRVQSSLNEKLSLLPLSFFPRFAGGITRLAPMVLNSAKELSLNTTEKPSLAIFLDFGFITNRTFRHVVRQLHAVGVNEVRGMGLLNRSSSPAFDIERNQSKSVSTLLPIPNTYWSWNVPILGTGTHCPLCGALPSLARLRHLAEETHVDLLAPLKKIGFDWHARDIADFGEESGLMSLPLNESLKDCIVSIFKTNGLAIDRVPNTSCILTSRIIEFLRVTDDTELPLKIAKNLLLQGGSEHAVELIATILILTGSSFTAFDLHEYVSLLTQASISLGTREYKEEDNFERISRLFGLVSLVFATQSSSCKLAVIDQLCQQLEISDINDTTELRIALIALTNKVRF